jgi:hypothetical protein
MVQKQDEQTFTKFGQHNTYAWEELKFRKHTLANLP